MRIRNLVWLVMVGLLGVATAGFVLFIYQAQSQALETGIDQELQTAALMAKEVLPPNFHDDITGPASVSPAEYAQIVDRFNRICVEAHLEYLWSLMVLDGKTVFTSATSPSKDVTQNDHAQFLEVHSNPELYTRAFETMQPQYQVNADKWGRIRAVLLPFRDSHGRPYLIGASRSMQAVDAQVRATLMSSLLASGLFMLAGLVLCWWLSRSLARPIEAITQAAADIAAGHLSRPVQVKGARELEQLGRSINTMSRSIETRLGELHESQQHFQTLAQVSPVGIFRTDPAGGCVYVNEQWVEITGVPVQQALGALWSQTAHPEDQPRVASAWAEHLAGGQKTFKLEFRFQPAGAPVTWVLAQSLAEHGADGRVLGHVGTLTNITDRKHAEQMIQGQNEQLQAQNEELLAQDQALQETATEMRQLNLELEQRVAGRTQELRLANAALQRAARLKDEFLANMSHELRTPLTGILGLTEALEMGVYDPPVSKQLRPLRQIHASGEHLLALINDILDVSKIEYGKVELQLATVSITDLCETSLLFVKQMALKKDLRLSVDYQLSANGMRADPRRLKQILVNLLSNAVKFTPAGGAAGLEVHGDAGEKSIHFTIWDTGIGIASENLSQLFQPFVQLDSRLAREYNGAGLGLALVMGLAELHGGGVSVESELGRGSRFTVTLPWVEANGDDDVPQASTGLTAEPPAVPAPAAPAQPADGRPAQGSGPSVLLADDNDTVLITLGDFLRAQNYEVRVARSGVEALELAQTMAPDLILMDIQMPVMDGLEAIRQLRTNSQLAAMPIIALTALAMPGDRERCLAAGANAYLSKPVSLSSLGQTIKLHLASAPKPPAQ